MNRHQQETTLESLIKTHAFSPHGKRTKRMNDLKAFHLEQLRARKVEAESRDQKSQ